VTPCEPVFHYAQGEVTDRAGRRGVAIGFDSSNSGLPTRYMLIVDPGDRHPAGIRGDADPGKFNERGPRSPALDQGERPTWTPQSSNQTDQESRSTGPASRTSVTAMDIAPPI
jgi:hypothetical protein